MPIVFISTTKDPEPWIKALKNKAPEVDINIHGQCKSPDAIDFALCWNHPEGALSAYPNLKVICSMGAGVDHLFRDKTLPEGVKICRILDTQLATDMNEFVIALIMNHLRGLNQYNTDQYHKTWTPRPYLNISDVKVGIMGFGQLGQSLASTLRAIGFKVSGWSNSTKSIDGIEHFVGPPQLPAFLKHSNMLICLLPLTEQTRGILNKGLFAMLPRGAFLINVGRGAHLVENDLIDSLDNGHLNGASLDVFDQEPLPDQHPFWTHPKVHITPHIASLTNPKSVVPQILENYRRMKEEQPLMNEVSREKGY